MEENMAGALTFLKKLGTYLAEGIAIASGVWPLVSPLFGSSAKAQNTGTTIINDLTTIGQVVVQAEALIQGTGTGPQKLAAAAPLVANIVKTSELVSGHKIANDTLFIQGCTDLTSAVAEILNSLDAGAVNSSGKPVTPAPAPSPASPVPTALSNPPTA
jgi:hypothetical protein